MSKRNLEYELPKREEFRTTGKTLAKRNAPRREALAVIAEQREERTRMLRRFSNAPEKEE